MFLTTVCVKLLGLYLPLYMFCCMRASVSGLMALLVLWFFSIKYIHSFKQVCLQLTLTTRHCSHLLLSAGRAAVDRYLLAAGPTAANPPRRRAAAGDGADGRTDARQFRKPCSAYYASGERCRLTYQSAPVQRNIFADFVPNCC